MCGIAGFNLSPNERPINARRLAQALLLGIEHRGKDATGAAWRQGDDIIIQKRNKTASEWVKTLSMPKATQSAILHTRAWTQGTPTNPANNHPIRTGSYVGVHNGTVWNDDYLFSVLGKDAPRHGDVDSEAIFALLAHAHVNTFDHPIAHDVDLLEHVVGHAAIAYMTTTDDAHTLHVARLAGSPLAVAQTVAGSFIFASEAGVILDVAKALNLDIGFLDNAVEEGTYLKVKQGIIVEQTRFQVDDWSSTRGGMSYVSNAQGWKWCATCKDWDNYCDCRWLKPEDDGPEVILPSEDADGGDEDYLYPLNPVAIEMFDPSVSLDEVEPQEWEFCYGNRRDGIQRWFNNVGKNDNFSDEWILQTANKMHAFTKPGDWVSTEVGGQRRYGQVVDVPNKFPGGEYILRVFIDRPGPGVNGMEAILLTRKAHQFENVAPATSSATDNMAGALAPAS